MEHVKQTNQRKWIVYLVSSLIVIIVLYSTKGTVENYIFDWYIDTPSYIIIPGILIGVSIWAIKVSDKLQIIPKKTLIFFAMAFSCWFIGEQIWTGYELLGLDPFPSPADFFYVLGYPLMFIGFVIFITPLRKLISKIILIFSIIVSVAVLIPSLAVTGIQNLEYDAIDFFFALLYPVLDSLLLILSIMILLLFSKKAEKNIFWILMLVGTITFVAADTLFLFIVMDDSYYNGHPVDISWLFSYVIWIFAIYKIIDITKKAQRNNIQSFKIVQKNNVENTTKFGISIMLIIINLTVDMLLVGVVYFWSKQRDSDFIIFISLIFGTLIAIFSLIIIYFNKKTGTLLEQRTEKLEQVSKELVKAERLSTIGELSGRFSHELRNPLSIIQVSIENLKRLYSVDEIQIKQFERIERSIGRISHQVNNVLDFVRGQPVDLNRVMMSEIIAESLDTLHIPKNIKLIIPKNDIELVCDKRQFSIVMNNLILNGIQAIKSSGTIEIIIEEDKKGIIVQIKDSGSGIPKEDLKKIFEPLFTTKQVGTGLGLASVKSVIELHGGTVSVTSPPTIFTITLPKMLDEYFG